MHRAEMHVTPRETQILSWVAAGKSDWAIGQILRISSKTVNFHVENAKRKFGVGTRVQAVVAALREGMIC
jgi:LuxR family transcriptional regulator, quorum-sensing system regulator LasR